MKQTNKRLLIGLRSFITVLLFTTNTWCVANNYYTICLIISAAISLMWTLNVKDLAICNWKDRLYYIVGGVAGTAISLYFISDLLKKIR